MSAPHAAVKHELLVRYLDAWTPAMLHGHKRVTYVESTPDSAASVAALRVFGEFSDLMRRHTLTMLIPAPHLPALFDPPDGLEVRGYDGPLALALPSALGAPIFGWFDGPAPDLESASTVASNKASSVMLAVPSGSDLALSVAFSCEVELVSVSGLAELLIFGTASEKELEKFKDELWALDEYAGIRLRDPTDDEQTLLDIKIDPYLAPLKRLLLSHLIDTRPASLGELRTWTLRSTVYRAADATRAVQGLVTARSVSREPVGGRLSPETMITPVS
jgi:hypothetical protein